MEPFSIACTTCQTTLRVRDRSAIGQILTCPKCGSMVLVEPPPEDASAASRGISPPPLPKANGDVAGAVGPSHPADLADTVEDPTLYGFVEKAVEEPLSDEPALDELASVEASVESGTADVADADAEPWTPEPVASWRRYLLLGFAGVAGIVLAVLLFGWLSGGANPEPIASKTPTSAKPSRKPSETPVTSETPFAPAAPSPASPATEAPKSPDPKSPTSAAAESKAPEEQPSLDPAPPTTPTPDPAKIPASEESPASSPAPAEKPAEAPAKEGPAAKRSAAASLREALKAFGADLEDDSTPDSLVDPGTGETPAPISPQTVMVRPEPINVDVDARLADVIQQIDFNTVPLIDFLDFVSDYSTIPITLDPDVLPWVQKSPETPVTARLTKASVGDVLNEGLKGVGLGFTVMDNQLLVGRVDSKGPRVREVTLELGDLTQKDAGQLDQIGQLIAELVAPSTWKSVGGIGTIQTKDQALVVKHEEPVLFQVLALCEKLRVARGLKPRSSLNPAMFQLTPRTERAQSKLESPVSLSCPRPERFAVLVRRLFKESGVEVLIDWRGAAQMGWNPSAMVAINVKNQPLSAVMRELLDPMQLTYRVVDESTLQITSRQTLDVRAELEFHPAKDLLTGSMTSDELRVRVETTLGKEAFTEGGGVGVLRYDAPSQCLLVSLPQPQQQRLARMLAQLRSAK